MGKEFSKKRIYAIRIASRLGRMWQSTHPEIVEWRRNYESYPTIARKLGYPEKDKKGHVAERAVQFFLAGFEGMYREEPYEGLMPDKEERERISEEVNRRSGNDVRKRKVGIYARNYEEMAEHGRRNLKNMTKKKREEMKRNAAIGRGRESLSRGEMYHAFRMSESPKFHHKEGSNSPGNPDYELIKDRLNERHHGGKPVRTREAVRSMVRRYERILKEEKE